MKNNESKSHTAPSWVPKWAQENPNRLGFCLGMIAGALMYAKLLPWLIFPYLPKLGILGAFIMAGLAVLLAIFLWVVYHWATNRDEKWQKARREEEQQ